jgi:catechol-2,3-dioxygenase
MPRIPPAKFVHVVYRTRRFEQMVRWYQTVFDARVQHQNPALDFLAYDDEHHRFAFANLTVLQPDEAETDRHGVIGVDHVAYTHASLNDLFENHAQLEERGIRSYWCVHHGIRESMFYADPDGNQMEFLIDSYGSNEEVNAFMTGPHFAANPVSVEFDPEDWLARLRGGAPPSAFLLRQADVSVSPIWGPMQS